MNRKIAVFTGTRAEYGLLYWLLKDIQSDPGLTLQLIVSGTHLSHEFGNTFIQIEKDGFIIDERIEILLSSDTPVGVAKSMGLGVLGFSDALSRLNPDALVILGDRFEALAAAQTAMILRIPVVHLHGGEITEGAYDDAIRHAITKLSYLHCTATEEYRQRVIQLGENPNRVKHVGAIGLDHLHRSMRMTMDELSSSLQFDFGKKFFLVTYHPVTLADEPVGVTFQAILDSIDAFPQYQVLLTYPNADNGSRLIIKMIEDYAAENPKRVLAVTSLGQERYFCAVKHASVVIGNSSSGIIEVPSFCVPTVNIGKRQKGRLAAKSVFHCLTDKESISKAIEQVLDGCYEKTINPYSKGNASGQILMMLKKMELRTQKSFFDLVVK